MRTIATQSVSQCHNNLLGARNAARLSEAETDPRLVRELDKELVTGDRGKCDRPRTVSLLPQIVTFRSYHVSVNEVFNM